MIMKIEVLSDLPWYYSAIAFVVSLLLLVAEFYYLFYYKKK